jgi:hypothetical protein
VIDGSSRNHSLRNKEDHLNLRWTLNCEQDFSDAIDQRRRGGEKGGTMRGVEHIPSGSMAVRREQGYKGLANWDLIGQS